MSSTETMRSLPRSIVSQFPSSATCQSALALASEHLDPAIFNHSIRVYLHARNLLEKEQKGNKRPATFFADDPIDDTLLFVAALFHDMGTTSLYNGKQRFEVEGADAACSHLQSCGVASERDLQRVWSAIALHTSVGIAERIDPFTRLIRVAVKIDFSDAMRAQHGVSAYATELENQIPRLNIEKTLADAVVAQAEKIVDPNVQLDTTTWLDSEKFPKASWPGILLRAHLQNPGYDGVNPAF